MTHRRAAVASLFLALLSSSCFAEVSPAAGANPWPVRAVTDIHYIAATASRNYIYSQYPNRNAWRALLGRLVRQGERESELAHDFAGYRAVVQHFVAGFADAHFDVHFLTPQDDVSHALDFGKLPIPYEWPGFLVRFRGDRYIVVYSRLKQVPAGETISSCDGSSLDTWVDRVAQYEGGPPGIDSTRYAMGRILFIDLTSPLHARPNVCTIGGRSERLQWTRITGKALQGLDDRYPQFHDENWSIQPFDDNAAWVRLGTFLPWSQTQAAQLRAVIAKVPDIRHKRFVVFDVRGNAGGDYNWFMAFVRAFYGPAYADYYARARLQISPVELTVLSGGKTGHAQSAKNTLPFSGMVIGPPDPPMTGQHPIWSRKLPDGDKLTKYSVPAAGLAKQTLPPPASLATAKVYVLTDYGCASACLSFLDEMRRFPSVLQIGTQTYIDRRSGGWPEDYFLPSGLGFVRMGRMVRDGRERPGNIPWTPQLRFRGDIEDTAAVKAWVLGTVVPKTLMAASDR